MAKILATGLNPAWQRVLTLPTLQPGAVNRVHVAGLLASGKGINAAKVLARMGHEVSLLQILAGENGRRCQEACGKWNIHSLHVRAHGEMRTCTTLLSESDGAATEIIEPFSVEDPDLTEQILARIKPNSVFDAVLICGTVPHGIPESIYGDILRQVKPANVLWDSVTGLTPKLLDRVSWLKMNAEEFASLSSLTAASRPKALITEGAKAARVLHSGSADGTYVLPPLAKTLNPIGAGDTVTAALADGLLRGLGEEPAVRRALSFGMASCLSPLPADYNPQDAQALELKIRKE